MDNILTKEFAERIIQFFENKLLVWQMKRQVESKASFHHFPSEFLSLICRYLTPTHVLNTFYDSSQRTLNGISKYDENVNLTNYLYSDFKHFLRQYSKAKSQPSTLIISNSKFCPTQFNFLLKHQSLTQISSCLRKFLSLKSLYITQSTSEKMNEYMKTIIISEFHKYIFDKPTEILNELTLILQHGFILNKQLYPNQYLKYLTISLNNINDLYSLFDGLVPNLISLNVTICQGINPYQQTLLPKIWPNQFMSYLLEFILTTNDHVQITLDQLYKILMPLNQLTKLILNIKEFLNDSQSEILIQEYLPKLQDFHCSIQTMSDIDMQVIQTLNKRWPIIYSICKKHFYTIPWSFKQLHLSMLNPDDTTSIYPDVHHLIVNIPFANIANRFPNLHTLTIEIDCNYSSNVFNKFPELRHLTIKHINVISKYLLRRIVTLTLSNIDHLLNHKKYLYKSITFNYSKISYKFI